MLTISLTSSCPWVPVSPFAGIWTYKPSRPQFYIICQQRHPCTHTLTNVNVGAPPDRQQMACTPEPSSCHLRLFPAVAPSEAHVLSPLPACPLSHLEELSLIVTVMFIPVTGTMDTWTALTPGPSPRALAEPCTHTFTHRTETPIQENSQKWGLVRSQDTQ